MKAAETIATNTFSPSARSIFSPENLDAQIKVLVPTGTPLRNRFPRVKGFGQATAWRKLTSKLNVNAADGGTNTSIAFADAAAPGETSQTYSVVSAAYKLLGRKLEIGGLAMAASQGGGIGNGPTPDAGIMGGQELPEARLMAKLYEVMLGEEELLIQGNATTRTSEFDGLCTQITTNSGTATFLTVSGINNNYFRTLFDAGASPTVLVCNSRQNQALSDELSNSGSIQRITYDQAGVGNITAGSKVAKILNSVDGTLVDVVTSRYVGDGAYVLTEKSPSGENWIEIEDLIPMYRVPVPSSNFSVINFIVEAMVLKVIAEIFCYKITGLAK